MPNFVCITCGTQNAATDKPPAHCLICEDDRQYVNPEGQSWIAPDDLRSDHYNALVSLEPGLTEIVTEPKFSLGGRALLVQASGGNVLWDCVSLVDKATVEAIETLGGISGLALSHPHMFGSMVEWSHAFGHVPIWLHADYKQWNQRPDPAIEFWEGESHNLYVGVTLHRCGGHFKGSTVLLWPDGADGRGVLLSTDTIAVSPDRQHVSFMYSYPNHIPLSASTVDNVVDSVQPLRFDRMYSHFHHREIESDAKGAVQRSAERYKQAIGLAS